jgi:hypothetical protein
MISKIEIIDDPEKGKFSINREGNFDKFRLIGALEILKSQVLREIEVTKKPIGKTNMEED